MDDIKALRPTIFPSVPRLYNRIYDEVRSTLCRFSTTLQRKALFTVCSIAQVINGVRATGDIKSALFSRACEDKKFYLHTSGSVTHALWDRVVFAPIKASIGFDRVRLLFSGSAPLASHVAEFLKIVFGCPCIEGYGQTECGGAATATLVSDQVRMNAVPPYTSLLRAFVPVIPNAPLLTVLTQSSLGHVGGPLPCNEVKLVSIPEMGYLVTDTAHGRELGPAGEVLFPGLPCIGRGEVCVRGPNVFGGARVCSKGRLSAVVSLEVYP
jgi:long-chain acyl-CoA synthetase